MLIFGHCLPSGIIEDNGFDSLVQGQPVLPSGADGRCEIDKGVIILISPNNSASKRW
jgi:hypothetical protein